MMGAMYLDQMWMRSPFVVKASSEQMGKLKPSFLEAWKKRGAAMKAQDAKALASVNQTLRSKIKAVLSAEQMKKLEPGFGAGPRPGGSGRGGARRSGN